MLKLLNKYKKWLIIFSFAYIYILMILLAPSKFIVLTPGEINNISQNYTIEDKEFTNNINSVSVYSWQTVTTFQSWLIKNNDRFDIREKTEYDNSLSRKELNIQGNISHESSLQNAIITAYTYAMKADASISIDYKLRGFSVYYSNNKELQIGDQIINVSDKNYFKPDKTYFVTIQRGNELKVINIKDTDIIRYYPKYEILSTSPVIKTKDNTNVSGPSGGMIQTLGIYLALMEINLPNVKLAGTGTINTNDLFEVGAIGGIVQKYYTVKKNKIDYFLVPKSNISELSGVINESDKVKVIVVETFDDVISFISTYRSGLNAKKN
jgi:Lon-like protease